MWSKIIKVLLIFAFSSVVSAQGFLHRDGKQIVDGSGQEFILRGIGLGGWMVQEGYMLQTSGFANAQREIRAKIEEMIGPVNTDAFYTAWLENYIQKADVDSLAAWGFNSIRLPMHYNLYTLPIEDEPVAGQNTWLERGFQLTDRLLQWCAANEIYLILDLHAAPGGQGKESAISDYDPAKPSLWESPANQAKTVALWRKLAERYANEPWIGGYDLLNETNWNMAGNAPLKNLYLQITDAIREVDGNHLVFIEGNWFANDFSGLTPPWDENMAYSFHKYWSYNDPGSIQWMLNIRDQYNTPIWCGESGENSNVWYTNAIRLMEANGTGWAWWPLKKVASISGICSVPLNAGYQQLLDYWSGSGSKPSVDAANQALQQLAEDYKLANCQINTSVIDAMLRQPAQNASRAFGANLLPGIVYASDYDFGPSGLAYFDTDTADYHVSTGSWSGWNQGWQYRNDGVDIGSISGVDKNNDFYIGWVETGEWLQYTVEVQQSAVYNFKLRMASENASGLIRLQLDSRNLTGSIAIPNTGGWQKWQNVAIDAIPLEAGTHRLRFYFDKAGGNFSYFEATNTGQPIKFDILQAATSEDGLNISAIFSKKLADPPGPTAGFILRANGVSLPFSTAVDSSGYILKFFLNTALRFSDEVTLSYTGSGFVAADGSELPALQNLAVSNNMPDIFAVPGKIEAEDFVVNNGFGLEGTSDAGGGENLGWSDRGDFVEYNISVPQGGNYKINYRYAAQAGGSKLIAEYLKDGKTTLLHVITFAATGGWQTWQNAEKSANLPAGEYVLRLRVLDGGFNLNWFEIIQQGTAVQEGAIKPAGSFQLLQNYPNPFNPSTRISFETPTAGLINMEIYDTLGRKVETLLQKVVDAGQHNLFWQAGHLPSGEYFIRLQAGKIVRTRKVILQK